MRSALLLAGKTLLIIVAAFGVWLGVYLLSLWTTIPRIDADSLQAEQSISVLDREGGELYRIIGKEDRTFLAWDDIPAHVKSAMIAVEDERFYTRPCVDVQAIVRALFTNVFGGQTQGASTITQQLARNIFLSPEKRIDRKLREIMIACRLENFLSKDDILHNYLNWIPFGHGAYGLERAAQLYFGVGARQLTVAQAAVLASLPQRPTYFSPYGEHVRTVIPEELRAKLKSGEVKEEDVTLDQVEIGLLGTVIPVKGGVVRIGGRSNQVLENMQRLGMIPPDVKEKAEKELRSMSFRPRAYPLEAPHFVLFVREKVALLKSQKQSDVDWDKAGLHVQTTLDPRLQQIAQETVATLFPAIGKQYKAENMALVAIDVRTRDIVAYIGNPEYFDEEHAGKIDMARVPRQPGSSFKPIVYSAFFRKGFDPKTIIQDTPLTIGSDRPKNYDGAFHGPMTVRTALAHSRNIPAIRAFKIAGGENAVLDLAEALGAVTPKRRKESSPQPFDYGWPLSIGSAEVPLIEMVQAYASIADGGIFKPAKTIREITDAQGNPLYTPPNTGTGTRVLEAKVTADIISILSDESARPTGWWKQQMHLPNGLQAAMKTGTSNLCLRRTANACATYGVNNVWAMGFTPDLAVGVWIGNANNAALDPKADGLSAAIPIWKDFIVKATAVRGDRKEFPKPAAEPRQKKR